jgi:hypothetical protein
LQTSAKELELERPNIDRKRPVTDELPELHVTPFQEHGSLVASHEELEKLRNLDRLTMMLVWFEDSSESTAGNNKNKKDKKIEVLCCTYLVVISAELS